MKFTVQACKHMCPTCLHRHYIHTYNIPRLPEPKQEHALICICAIAIKAQMVGMVNQKDPLQTRIHTYSHLRTHMFNMRAGHELL